MAQAVIAVRGGPDAKSRCAEALSGPDRAGLTAAMLEDMLDAIARCPEVSQTWVVTPTPELAELALSCGAKAIAQGEPEGVNAAFRQAIAEVSECAPYDAMLLMPGDLPLLQPDELTAAALLLRTHAVVMAPALDRGTGLLGLRAGAVLPPAFGADSFKRHSAAVGKRGLPVAILATSSLSRDVDRPEDLQGVLDQGPATKTAAFLRGRLQPRISS